jgi:hypothetical protein
MTEGDGRVEPAHFDPEVLEALLSGRETAEELYAPSRPMAAGDGDRTETAER